MSELHVEQGTATRAEDPLARIQALLRSFPQAQVESTDRRVVVHPVTPDGFRVTFELSSRGARVACEGWHEEFADPAKAVACFAFALSPECRLRVTRRAGVAHKWELQAFENGRWSTDSEVGLLFYPFWARAKVSYLQNALKRAA